MRLYRISIKKHNSYRRLLNITFVKCIELCYYKWFNWRFIFISKPNDKYAFVKEQNNQNFYKQICINRNELNWIKINWMALLAFNFWRIVHWKLCEWFYWYYLLQSDNKTNTRLIRLNWKLELTVMKFINVQIKLTHLIGNIWCSESKNIHHVCFEIKRSR